MQIGRRPEFTDEAASATLFFYTKGGFVASHTFWQLISTRRPQPRRVFVSRSVWLAILKAHDNANTALESPSDAGRPGCLSGNYLFSGTEQLGTVRYYAVVCRSASGCYRSWDLGAKLVAAASQKPAIEQLPAPQSALCGSFNDRSGFKQFAPAILARYYLNNDHRRFGKFLPEKNCD